VKIEDQVCTLEQAKKLKELGVTIESEFIWSITLVTDFHISWSFGDPKAYPETWYPAYTLAELSAMYINDADTPHYFDIEYDHNSDDYCLYKHNFGAFGDLNPGVYSTETHAYAAAIIWMLENEYLRVGDLKL
jgi:hypothetical protein